MVAPSTPELVEDCSLHASCRAWRSCADSGAAGRQTSSARRRQRFMADEVYCGARKRQSGLGLSNQDITAEDAEGRRGVDSLSIEIDPSASLCVLCGEK